MITGINASTINATHSNDAKDRGEKTQDSLKNKNVSESASTKAQHIKDQIAQDTYEINIPQTSKKMALDLLNL